MQPTFAVVGAVNHGKSSVVAALAEDDAVRVSPMPGETVANKRFALRDLLVFFDTPGFQNARKALVEIERLAADEKGALAPFLRFVEIHRDDPDFEAECRLLAPIVEGAGIIYVVDGARPLRDINGCEMEILERTGAPRLAIVNRGGDGSHVESWKRRLEVHFDRVVDFDAHRATFADRIELLDALAHIAPDWSERLHRAADAMRDERRDRIDDAAALIEELVIACVRHTEKAPSDAAEDAAARATALKARYMTSLARLERDAHRRLIVLFAHRHVVPDAMPAALFGSDLFAEETWALFGLGPRQLVTLSTVAGGVAGAGIDAVTLGHSFGVGAAIGAVTGGGGAFLLGKRRPELAIRWPASTLPGFVRRLAPTHAMRFGGGELVVGPYQAENFPWIVIDRALCLFADVQARSHARRDAALAPVETMLPRLDALHLSVAHWPDAARAAAQKAFKAARRGEAPEPETATALTSAIRDALEAIARAD